MTFRRLYWVAEQVEADGRSTMTGVYTSIADLVHKGLLWRSTGPASLRLTLIKPDTFDSPLGRWDGTSFDTIEADMAPFEESGEMSVEEVKMLVEGLGAFLGARA